MHFLGRKLTSFGPKPWGGGLEGQRFLDLDRYAFFGAKTDVCLAYGPKLWGGGLEGQRSLDLDRYAFFGAKTDVL